MQRACEHWSMAFHVTPKTIYIRCMSCNVVAALLLDGKDNFTTGWARTAIEHRLEQQKKEGSPASEQSSTQET